MSQQAIVGVLAFTMAYTLGSAISRIAQDFFNDDDVNFRVARHQFRVGVTEDRIRTNVYCGDLYDTPVLRAESGNEYVGEKISEFQAKGKPLCWQVPRWFAGVSDDDDALIRTVGDIFGFQENAVLLTGEENTLRLRQLHDQIMVLRGAAFNGVVALSLCCFGCGVAIGRESPKSRLFRAIATTPGLYLVLAAIAVVNHVSERAGSDPPYMEFTLFLLSGAGAWLLWKRPARYLVVAPLTVALAIALRASTCFLHDPRGDDVCVKLLHLELILVIAAFAAWLFCRHLPRPARPSESAEHAPSTTAHKSNHWTGGKWAGLMLLSFFLTLAVTLGWWSTEVLYTEQVIYSYQALNKGLIASDKSNGNEAPRPKEKEPVTSGPKESPTPNPK